MALAIERILEPFAGYIVPSTTLKKAQAKATATKVTRPKPLSPAVPAVPLYGNTGYPYRSLKRTAKRRQPYRRRSCRPLSLQGASPPR